MLVSDALVSLDDNRAAGRAGTILAIDRTAVGDRDYAAFTVEIDAVCAEHKTKIPKARESVDFISLYIPRIHNENAGGNFDFFDAVPLCLPGQGDSRSETLSRPNLIRERGVAVLLNSQSPTGATPGLAAPLDCRAPEFPKMDTLADVSGASAAAARAA